MRCWVAVLVAAYVATGAAASSGITGFGATEAAWTRAHVEDRTYAAGAAYDPDPSLPKVNGRTADRYYSVIHQDGHVLGYGYRFGSQGISHAKALVLRTQFPTDVRVVWFAVRGTCAQMLVRSARLASAIGRRPIGDKKGTALIGFSSGEGDSYSAPSVNGAIITPSGLVSKSSVGC